MCVLPFLIVCVTSVPMSQTTDAFIEGNTTFGVNLFHVLRHADEQSNIFYSLYSISSALAMTYAGARGVTAQEMAKVFHWPEDQDAVHLSFAALQRKLDTVSGEAGVQLDIANSIWVQKGITLLPCFMDILKTCYSSEAHDVDFVAETEGARHAINEWTAGKTKGHIKELIQPGTVNASTVLVLCNAVYFSGLWQSPFKPEQTHDAPFYTGFGEPVTVPMMHQTMDTVLGAFDGMNAIELPYGNGTLSMILFLPSERGGLKSLEEKLTPEKLLEWITLLERSNVTQVSVFIPKFKFTSAFELSEILAEMGMPSAFNDADFSGMTGSANLAISKVVHQAYIDVHETGTKAAAATAVVMVKSAMRSPAVFRADHPFIFLIRDRETQSILFLGRVVNPLS